MLSLFIPLCYTVYMVHSQQILWHFKHFHAFIYQKHLILFTTCLFPHNIVHNIFVSSQYCPQHVCFLTILFTTFLFPHNIVYNIFVSSQYCPQHVCFLTILSTSFLFLHNIVHNMFVSSQYWPHQFCFLTILSTTFFVSSQYCPHKFLQKLCPVTLICHHEILIATFSRHFDPWHRFPNSDKYRPCMDV